ncbi:hypothetical protein SCHPADRAFT_893220 [Schizopora paradoxa]|uniref:Uncharacterized protein n=1 Tax=Schizopora paradoxa TaxID=27342 RepID=A0A0H2RCT2_9AGAM|nr:hypothetical protein SCHPADRAFT_893220 [Schizopora paradoxa]
MIATSRDRDAWIQIVQTRDSKSLPRLMTRLFESISMKRNAIWLDLSSRKVEYEMGDAMDVTCNSPLTHALRVHPKRQSSSYLAQAAIIAIVSAFRRLILRVPYPRHVWIGQAQRQGEIRGTTFRDKSRRRKEPASSYLQSFLNRNFRLLKCRNRAKERSMISRLNHRTRKAFSIGGDEEKEREGKSDGILSRREKNESLVNARTDTVSKIVVHVHSLVQSTFAPEHFKGRVKFAP